MNGRDQAGALRDLVSRRDPETEKYRVGCPTIAVTSGKGGVGKTNVSIFLAKTLAARGEKVLLFDGDLGLANLHILLGVSTPFTLRDYLTGKCSLSDCIVEVEPGIYLLAGSSGNLGLANISPRDLGKLLEKLDGVTEQFDRLIVDGGAGIADSSLALTLSADQVLVVITPDPTSLADAYATMKLLYSKGCKTFYVVINMVDNDEESSAVEEKLALLTERFLGFIPEFAGRLPRNKKLSTMIRQERSLLTAKGLGDFVNRMNHIAQIIQEGQGEPSERFFSRFLTLGKES